MILRRVRDAALVLLGIAYVVAGLTLIATLTPGGITLGLLLLGMNVLIYLLWVMTRILLHIRELLMLSVAREHKVRPKPDAKNDLPSSGLDAGPDGTELLADA